MIHSFLTSTLGRGEWLASRLGCFISRETVPWYPMCRRLDVAPDLYERFGELINVLLLPGFEPALLGA